MTDWKYHTPAHFGHRAEELHGKSTSDFIVERFGENGWKEISNPQWEDFVNYRYKRKPADAPPRCDACTFFDRGECKMYPPSMFPPPSYGVYYPRVEDYYWCGEFKKK